MPSSHSNLSRPMRIAARKIPAKRPPHSVTLCKMSPGQIWKFQQKSGPGIPVLHDECVCMTKGYTIYVCVWR